LPDKQLKSKFSKRFRGLLPVVVDIETSGLNPQTDALLEIAAVSLNTDKNNTIDIGDTYAYHIEPFVGARMDPESLAITGIDPGHPLRYAVPEQQVLHQLFSIVQELVEENGCQRAVLVGHNAWFDLAFLQAATKRCNLKSSPFHSFTSFDTATLAGVFLGETVLAKAMKVAEIEFNAKEAHSAIYDAEKTAELFCYMINKLNS